VYRPTNGYWIIRNSSGGISTPLMGDPTQGDIAVEASPYYMIHPPTTRTAAFASSLAFSTGSTAASSSASVSSAHAQVAQAPIVRGSRPNGSIGNSSSLWKFGTNLSA